MHFEALRCRDPDARRIVSAGVLGSGTGKWKETEKPGGFPWARWKCSVKGAGENGAFQMLRLRRIKAREEQKRRTLRRVCAGHDA